MNQIPNELKINFLIYLDRNDINTISKVDISFNDINKRWKSVLEKEMHKRMLSAQRKLQFWFCPDHTLKLPGGIAAIPYNVRFELAEKRTTQLLLENEY